MNCLQLKGKRFPFPITFLSTISKSSIESTISLFPQKQKLNLIYDSKCILCQKEIMFLQKRDKDDQIIFTDIESDSYDPNDAKNGYINYKEGMQIIHAVKSDGTILKGVEVFRSAYSLVNLSWIWSIYSYPLARKIMDKTYLFWAKYRTYLTRNGKSIDTLSIEREKRLKYGHNNQEQEEQEEKFSQNIISEDKCKAYENAFK